MHGTLGVSPAPTSSTVASPQSGAIAWWMWPHLLSLDAPAVAVLWLELFAQAFAGRLSPYTVALLPLAVWIIYIADRILDARHSARTPRHRFYGTHARVMTAIAAGATLTGIALAFHRLPLAVFRRGELLGASMGMYFAAVHVPALHIRAKEFVIAAVFALGCAIPFWPGLVATPALFVPPVAAFLMLCWMNTALIESWEWRSVRLFQNPRPHSSSAFVASHLHGIAIALAALALVLALADWPRSLVYIAIALSACALAALDRAKARLSPDMVRVLADIALLLPAPLLWVR